MNSAHQIDWKLILHAVLIIDWWRNFGWNFCLWNFDLFAYNSTIKRVMIKWRSLLNSAHQIDSEISLTRFLIIIERKITGEDVQATSIRAFKTENSDERSIIDEISLFQVNKIHLDIFLQ